MGHLSRSQGALKRPWALLFIAFGETKPTPSPLRQRGSSFARAGFDLPTSSSQLPTPNSELPAPQPTRSRLMEYGDSSPFSSAPRSALTVQGPPQLAPAPFVVPPSGGLSFPAEAGTPTGSSHLEQAPGRPRRSTLQFDSVGRVHDSEIGMHRCGHNPPVSPEGTSLSKPRVEPMRGTSEAQPWVTRTTQKQEPEGLTPTLSQCQHRTANCLCSTSSITITSTSTNFALVLVLSDSGARTRNRRSCAAETPSLPAHLRRSTLRVDSVSNVHNSEVGTHRCGHNPRVSPEGTSLIKPRVEPMRGTSEAQPWVTRTTQNRSPKGWP